MLRLYRQFLSVAVLLLGMTTAAAPRYLILDEDNDHYFKNPSEWMDEAHLKAYVDLMASGGKVTHVFFCPTGGRASFDSKTWEPIWQGLSESPKEEIFFLFRRWSENAKSLHDKGIDPYEVFIRRCREKGISPWLSPRMNDAHDGASYGHRKPYRNTTFWRMRKDLRCYPNYTRGSWRHHQLDYSKREVRENALAMIEELFERYDFDGLNLHANRWFPDETARSNIPVMMAFVRDIRKMADRWEKRRGHKIGLSVCRAGFTPEACRDRGFDAAAMAREGLLDIIVCQPDTMAHFGEVLPVDLWRREIGNSRTAIVAGRGERLFQGDKSRESKDVATMNFTAEMFRGWADQQATAGADGFYLFNVEYQPKDQFEICRTGLMPEDIRSRSRVYPCITNSLPSRLDKRRDFRFVVGSKHEGVVSAVVGFDGAMPGLSKARLNGVAPADEIELTLERENFDECRKGDELYVSMRCPAKQLFFPSETVRTGVNVLTLPSAENGEIRYLELRIDPASDLPKVWMSFSRAVNATNFETCAVDCKDHGVDVVESPRRHSVEDYRAALAVCRKLGLKMYTSISDASRQDSKPDAHGPFEPAVMIGGVYRGRAIDRTLFSFTATRHEIVLEPPVYAGGQPYRKSPHYFARGDGHYIDGYVPTRKAEIIVPERLFDGRQHLKIIPAALEIVPPDTEVENDTAAKLVRTDSIQKRLLVRLKFDLTGLDNCLLDKIGIAVYWQMATDGPDYDPTRASYSVFSPFTRQRERDYAVNEIELWKKANDGTFPSDIVIAARLGDESFNISSWCGADRRVNFPTWNCSPSALAAFSKACPGSAYPRAWGFPEIYGEEAPAKFLYLYHRAAAEYLGVAAEEFHRVGVKVFRNTTRGFVFSPGNEHDGTGQELLAQTLDFLHLDPYPLGAKGYDANRIPSDMAYFEGLSRRYSKPIIVWMQAHSFPAVGLSDSSAGDIRRMYGQVAQRNPAAIMWLGYCPKGGTTFPLGDPAAWEAAKDAHGMFHRTVGTSPACPDVAFRRTYEDRAVAAGFGNSGDERTGRSLSEWSAKKGGRYDVFEVPPSLDEVGKARIEMELSAYKKVVGAGTAIEGK